VLAPAASATWLSEREIWPKCSYPSSDEIRIDVLSLIDLKPVVTCLTVEYPDTIQFGRRRPIRYVPRHFQRFECRYQCKSLHWINLHGFSWRYIEELGIEESCILNKALKEGVVGVHPFP
jgi:hypothetical protein